MNRALTKVTAAPLRTTTAHRVTPHRACAVSQAKKKADESLLLNTTEGLHGLISDLWLEFDASEVRKASRRLCVALLPPRPEASTSHHTPTSGRLTPPAPPP